LTTAENVQLSYEKWWSWLTRIEMCAFIWQAQTALGRGKSQKGKKSGS